MRHLLATQTPSELTEELEAVTEHISRTQEYIGRKKRKEEVKRHETFAGNTDPVRAYRGA